MAIETHAGVLHTIEGKQAMVGNRTAKWYKLSIVEVGDRVFQNLTISERLIIFLKAGEHLTLHLDGKQIIALERADGKLFVADFEKPAIISLILGIVCIPFYGLGLLILFLRHLKGRHYREVEKIIAKHPNYENLRG